MTQIILPHSGYKKLIVYKKSDVIYQGTVLFCQRFLPAAGDRTVDQMTQAARSCKQNIAEGSSAAATSIETEIRLTNVARATLDELKEDYIDYLKSHGETIWPSTDQRNIAAREFAKMHADWEDWKPVFTGLRCIAGVYQLYVEPNPNDPLNHDVAKLMRDNIDQFKENVKRTLRGGYQFGQQFQRFTNY